MIEVITGHSRDADNAHLKLLFGDAVVLLAELLDAARLDLSASVVDQVQDGADALAALRERPAEQQRYVGELPFIVRLGLCMWLMDAALPPQ